MQTEIFTIAKIGDGFLAAMPRPNKYCDLEAGVQLISDTGVNRIVSLLELKEATNLGLIDERSIAERHNIEFVNLPIADLKLPQSASVFAEQSKQLYDTICEGVNTLVHCRAGIGRTGMLCAAILANAGYTFAQAIDRISAQRGVRVPDTQVQLQWLEQSWIEFTNEGLNEK